MDSFVWYSLLLVTMIESLYILEMFEKYSKSCGSSSF
ncbi:hypothetical protein BG20_I2191, partial [Candidatus Nitrosarchaeum limnium BG20]